MKLSYCDHEHWSQDLNEGPLVKARHLNCMYKNIKHEIYISKKFCINMFQNCYSTTYISVIHLIALRYKPTGRGFDSRWCHWNFSVTILPVALWTWGRLTL